MRPKGAVTEIEQLKAQVTAFEQLLEVHEQSVIEQAVRIESAMQQLRCQAEAFRRSEERYRALYDDNPSMYFTVDAEGTVLSVNGFGAEQLGYRTEELVGRSVLNVFYEGDREAVCRQLEEAFRNPGRLSQWELRKVHKDGSLIWVREDVRIVQSIDATPMALIVCEDINAHKHMEQSLRESEERLRLAVAAAKMGTWDWDIQTNKVMLSDSVKQVFGLSQESFAETYEAYLKLVREEDRDMVGQSIARCIEEGTEYNVEHRIMWPDGSKHWLACRGAVLRDEAGKAVRMLGTVVDITDHKRAEQEVRNSQSFLQTIVDHLPVAVFAKAAQDGRFVVWNKTSERLFGLTAEQALGKTDHDFFPKGQADFFRQKDRETFEARRVEDIPEEPIDSHSLGRRLLHTIKAPIFNDDGAPLYLLGISEDITERRRLEEQLYQSQKMEAIGRLAEGVAHDFNDLLTVVRGYIELIQARFDQDDAAHRQAEKIKKAAEQAASLTQQLLAFSRRQVDQPKEVNISTLVAKLAGMLQRLVGENIRLITNLEPDLGLVKADPSQLELAIVHLAVNARDAMSRGGTLTIETANVEAGHAGKVGWQSVHPGIVRLTICDSGYGMDAEILSHIFEPFFTTKEMGRGIGLGLSTVYGIVKQSGGTIRASSEPGRGAGFTIDLPRIEAARQVAKMPSAPARSLTGSETILLVEDMRVVREFVREILMMSGYQVLEAVDGEEALRICGSYEGPIHLLLTDVTMQGMGGSRLAEQVVATRDQMKVLFMSGYIEEFGLPSDRLILQKPFTPDALVRKVREVLDSPHEGND